MEKMQKGNLKENILLGKYKMGRLLGQGNFAKVYCAKNLKTGDSVAVKVMDKESITRVGMMEQIKREISIMRLVRHPNIVQLYEVMASKAKIYFVMEYVKGGELFNKVSRGKKLKEDVARKYFQQLISAVDFCHSRGVYHRDLKPENLLVDDDGNLKVSDFGLSALPDQFRQDGEDGDLVTISSDLELEEILSNASGQSLIFTLSTNEDDNKNSWVLEGDSMEPYRIVQENNLNGEEPLTDQNPGEITKEPTIETETKPKSVTFHLHTTVTDETHEPSFGPTITNDKNEETQNRNEFSAPSTSSSSSAKSQAGINSSASTSEEAKKPKKGPETIEETDPNNLWEEALKKFFEYEDTPQRETPPENLGESSSNVNPRLVRISPPHHSRQTYDPRILGFDNPRCGRSFTFSRPTQNPYIARAANTRSYCGCCSNQCTYSANYCSCTTDSQRHPPQYNYEFSPRPFSNCRDQFHPLFKFIFRIVATIMFLSVIITVVKTAFFILCLLFPIAFFIIPIVFFVKVHNRLYVRREHFGRPFFRSRNPMFSYDAQFLRRRHGGIF